MAVKTQTSIKIDCKNLAPISNLSRKIAGFQRIRLGVYANNGSGKTFISRMFALTENKDASLLNCDKYISFGEAECEFNFQINSVRTEDNGKNIENVIDNLKIKISRGLPPSISEHKYKYHVFNSDYIDKNVRQFSYAKDGDNITGFILGEGNIDIEDEKKQLKTLQINKINIEEAIKILIKTTLEEKINSIKDIKRIKEYQDLLNYNTVISAESQSFILDVSYSVAYSQYDSIKNFPDNIPDIDIIKTIVIPTTLLQNIENILFESFELSNLASEFKEKIKSKYDFILMGTELLINENCPFCEQTFNNDALLIIDKYNKFIKDAESITIKKIEGYIEDLGTLSKEIEKLQEVVNKRKIVFDNYTSKYIFSMKDISLSIFDDIVIKNACNLIERIIEILRGKIENISKSITYVDNGIIDTLDNFNKVINFNNNQLTQLNRKKNDIHEENKNIRRVICKLVYNELLNVNHSNIATLNSLTRQIKSKEKEIETKLETVQVGRRDTVAKTIKQVLKYFFADKYKFEESSFSFFLREKSLDSDELSSVFSDGEKSLVAFAYYLGDTHLRIKNTSDYQNIFFIIDDPISSLDFNYVYTMSGILKDFSHLFPQIGKAKERLLVLTHNLEFMRILAVNEIVSKKLFLKNNTLKDFNINYTIPYIEHLCDIYEISIEKQEPSHTTANSVRHIIETMIRFENCSIADSTNDAIYQFMKDNLEDDITIYTFMQDLSHGAYRPEQPPLTNEQYVKVCKAVIDLIRGRYEGQIKFMEKYEKARA